ncbi:hypothetical protein LRF89_13230 [Halorhodospira sp. 9621]|uniref:hypothetical protein n=1 Tax=Halorhodospira TaxID=85108 RepID=UPI001EE8E3B2|nr:MULTISPECIES: hypothetical protein [Halorhodospira]MCG5534395.1 hypothetical protein [Halorhodospira sp. 9621]MCG5548911.1 hypothetical protein [Halorhodospira halochloris]
MPRGYPHPALVPHGAESHPASHHGCLGHRDPFDRLLIHCAIQEHLTLLSADSAFADYRPYGLKLIDD